ncbi:hypothetical protein JI59_11275 [Novosphingobium pentaromativorans US6-1]|nr:hypothetical protein JI59_11275 [Novosphingobium pentaromativorans US6-1]
MVLALPLYISVCAFICVIVNMNGKLMMSAKRLLPAYVPEARSLVSICCRFTQRFAIAEISASAGIL